MRGQRRQGSVRAVLVGAVVTAGAGLVAVPAEAGVSAVAATVVRSVDTARYNPPSSDPTGIVYLPTRNRLLISDSEVDETSLFRGVNLFETSRAGDLRGTSSTTAFTREPSGLGYRPSDGHLFVCDDDFDDIYEVAAGADARYGTADDAVTRFDTRVVGNVDAEDVTVNTANGHLFTVDEVSQEVFDYGPGLNGRFDGVPPAGDDTVRHFDVRTHGARSPEGIAYDQSTRTLLVLDQPSRTVYELTTAGQLRTRISISAANSVNASGIAVAPASDGSGRTRLYIVDRGVDNQVDANENDGRLYEMSR
jgi:hypothetical protein